MKNKQMSKYEVPLTSHYILNQIKFYYVHSKQEKLQCNEIYMYSSFLLCSICSMTEYTTSRVSSIRSLSNVPSIDNLTTLDKGLWCLILSHSA